MAVIDMNMNFQRLSDCWFPKELGIAIRQLVGNEASLIEDWINTNVFNAALAIPEKRMNVTDAIRRAIPNAPSWVWSPLQPLYDRTGQDEEWAAKYYGNYVCRVGIARPDRWVTYPEVRGDERHSRTYMLQSAFAPALSDV